MSVQLVVALVAFVVLALVIAAVVLYRHDRAERQRDERNARAFALYHARRAREIGDAIREMGDEAEHLFPPARNGGTR